MKLKDVHFHINENFKMSKDSNKTTFNNVKKKNFIVFISNHP